MGYIPHMELPYAAVFAAALAGTALFLVVNAYWSQKAVWRKFAHAAESLGAVCVSHGYLSSPHIEGVLNGMELFVERNRYLRGEPTITVRLRHFPALSGAFSIGKETALSRISSSVGIKDLQTGDRLFDENICLEAEKPFELLAFLNSDLRDLIREMDSMGKRLEIDLTHVMCTAMESRVRDCDEIVCVVRKLLAISAALGNQRPVLERIRDNIEHDPVIGVREMNLKVLLENFPDEKMSRDFLVERLHSPVLEDQVLAARHLGQRGMEALTRFSSGLLRGKSRRRS
jgi:hypothetical protein